MKIIYCQLNKIIFLKQPKIMKKKRVVLEKSMLIKIGINY